VALSVPDSNVSGSMRNEGFVNRIDKAIQEASEAVDHVTAAVSTLGTSKPADGIEEYSPIESCAIAASTRYIIDEGPGKMPFSSSR
jgi:hypothetical protein